MNCSPSSCLFALKSVLSEDCSIQDFKGILENGSNNEVGDHVTFIRYDILFVGLF